MGFYIFLQVSSIGLSAHAEKWIWIRNVATVYTQDFNHIYLYFPLKHLVYK